VDWVLTYAKDYIKHIPQVLLTGYIKNSTKAKWERILADERAGIQHNVVLEQQATSTWDTTDMPLSCHCSTPCAFSNYYSAVSHRSEAAVSVEAVAAEVCG